jgi:RNA polymerase sigma factor (sigma-70 family)
MSLAPFDDVIDEHGAVVMRVVRALLGPADADDAWAETFLAALEAYPRLRADSNVRGWLVTIAHRKALDHLRAAARGATPAAEVPEQAADAAVERNDELWAAVQALPFKQRAAVAYHHLAGLPYAEVARLVDTTETAARRAAADGIARLRQTYPRGAAS